jgi:glyoxylase-like metal-dependent hydrolase (beta-lactamase superfamily II)
LLIRFSLGELQLTLLSAGYVWLDGGAMFGVVPRVLWEQLRRPDEKHRIRLAMNLLLIDDGRQRTLVDTGAGDKWDEKACEIYGIEPRTAEEVLAPAGIRPEQIDRVVNTHLHFDHAGGNTIRDAGGSLQPAFTNAEYVVQRGELETARWDNERIRASYMGEHFEPLAEDAGRLRLVDGDVDLGAGLRLEVAPGHTPYMQTVRAVTPAGTLVFLADLVPTSSHLRYPYIMGYDLEPLRTLATKKRLLPRAAREGWRVIFEHDDGLPLATLAEERGTLVAHPWEPRE